MNKFNQATRSFTANTSRFSSGSLGCATAALLLSFGMLHSTFTLAAESSSNGRSTKVVLTDLDLSTIEGQRVAQQRLDRMARTLCNRVADEQDLSHHENYLKCVSKADADAQVHLQAMVSQQSTTRFAKANIK